MTFNFSKLFKLAHQIAKANRANFASYREAFAASLKAAWKEFKNSSDSPVGQNRQWAFNRYNALKTAQKNARAAYKASKTAENAEAFERAANAVHNFANELCNRCAINGRAIRNLDNWFRTSISGDLYDAEDLIEAA